MNAQQKLLARLKKGNHICVGLDTDISKIPMYLHSEENPIVKFNRIVIDNTAEFAAAYKINFAFYEKDGAAGFDNLLKTLEFIPDDVLVIADAKRGDIGNTSDMYALSIFNYFNFDAVTLNPYMGHDSLLPFLNYNDKINFILALTSNKGSADFEKQKLADGTYLFQKVIESVNDWNANKNCGVVFGATNLEELKDNITSFKDLFVLLPGVGAQGGSLQEVVKAFSEKNNINFLINISRALLYLDKTTEFGKKIKLEMTRLNSEVLELLGI
ncbi:MAG: orotidine-5'-phosphate decarboxylase [Ignavibacteriales bacterium]|nr:MAG: orotidine-5'-phosphate decarboxylase [Ignavibacteriales bacterium]